MINVVCDQESWAELLRTVPVECRMSKPSEYCSHLLDKHGRPILLTIDNIEIHIYPPNYNCLGSI